MKALTAILFLALGLPAQGAWVLTGMTIHECGIDHPTAVKQEYCVEGEKFVADLFVVKPQIVDLVKYNKLIKTGPGKFMANTLIRIPTGEVRPNGTVKRYPYYTIDTFEILEKTFGEELWSPVFLRVVNQANREFVIEKSLAIHECVMWLRGDWTGVPSNVGVVPNPIIDATLRYEKTQCFE